MSNEEPTNNDQKSRACETRHHFIDCGMQTQMKSRFGKHGHVHVEPCGYDHDWKVMFRDSCDASAAMKEMTH
eukprot:8308483-Karenia_brevis.AAC.1